MMNDKKTEVLGIAKLRIGDRLPGGWMPSMAGRDAAHERIDDILSAVCEALTSRDLILGAQAIVMAVLRGTGDTGAAALVTLSLISRAVVRFAADSNGDVGEAARGLVLGAIATSGRAGIEMSAAALVVAQAARAEAEQIGQAAASQVHDALKENIGGSRS